MEERQPPQISVIDTSSTPKRNEQQVFDLENPPADRQRINDDDDISELENDQYADDDATTYTTYTTIIKRSSYRYRYLTVAIVVITIIIIFLSRGAVVGGGVNAKNQDVENTIDSAVGGSDRGGGGGGGGGSIQVVKVEQSEKSKKSKSGKW